METLFVTGGCGFIGSNLVRFLLNETDYNIVNIDKLTYAGNQASLDDVNSNDRYHFEKVDLCDLTKVNQLFRRYQPQGIMHLAAESHVDRSIDGPDDFIQTNIIGAYNLLQASLTYWSQLPIEDSRQHTLDAPTQATFRFLHVSTDEVYGSLRPKDPAFSENTPYDPHSPYSASKAASDHLARAWHDTYGIPILITNCSNNYGPYQFPEKLIPVVILKCLRGEPIPVYGKGENIRDWLYVEDHCRALKTVFEKGSPGETYNIGGNNERQNIELVRKLCKLVEEVASSIHYPLETKDCKSLITFVTDRPGHDLRYAINASKIKNELGWEPRENFESGFRKTVQWYLKNQDWWESILSGNYNLERLGQSEVSSPK